jgi:chromosome segregation ATPase
MNGLGFFFHRIAWQLGFRAERKRWGVVNREMQILSKAEDLLGQQAWRDVKDIEALTGEYWQILEIDEEQNQLRLQTRETDAAGLERKEQLDEIKWQYEDRFDVLRERKTQLNEKAREMIAEVEQMRAGKEEVKRRFNSLNAKVRVISKQGEDMQGEIDKTREAMDRVKEEFDEELAQLKVKTDELAQMEMEIEVIDEQLSQGRGKQKESTSELSNEVGQLMKQVAELSAKIGALDAKKSEFYTIVGRHLSNNLDSKDPATRAVLRKHSALMSKIAQLRKSISYNQRLALRSSS